MQKVRYYLSFNSLRIKFQYLFQIFGGPINLDSLKKFNKASFIAKGQ